MSKKLHGVASFTLIMAFVAVGLAASFRYSAVFGVTYLAIAILGIAAVVLAYCAKCPGKRKCVHVVPGLIARHIKREVKPYNAFEYTVTALAFILLLAVPLPALLKNTALFILFAVFAAAAVMELLMIVCGSCYNVFCPMKRIAFTGKKQ